jgi:hypothetical protein
MAVLPGENQKSQDFQATNQERYPFMHNSRLGYGYGDEIR